MGQILKLYRVLICVPQILDEICHAHYKCALIFFFFPYHNTVSYPDL